MSLWVHYSISIVFGEIRETVTTWETGKKKKKIIDGAEGRIFFLPDG